MTMRDTVRYVLRGGAILGFALLAACAPAATQADTHPSPDPALDAATTTTTGPCADSAYAKLQQRPLDSLSAREWQRLQALDRQCARPRGHASHSTGTMSHGGHMMGTGIVASIVMLGMMAAMWW